MRNIKGLFLCMISVLFLILHCSCSSPPPLQQTDKGIAVGDTINSFRLVSKDGYVEYTLSMTNKTGYDLFDGSVYLTIHNNNGRSVSSDNGVVLFPQGFPGYNKNGFISIGKGETIELIFRIKESIWEATDEVWRYVPLLSSNFRYNKDFFIFNKVISYRGIPPSL